MEADAPTPFGVYVHIPFCRSKCDYCAFATWTDRHHLSTPYLDALRTEIGRAVEAGMPPATSIFVGGGTPSMVDPDQLMVVLATIPVTSDSDTPAEITIESNPDDITPAMLDRYIAGGVNRISLGVQSAVPHVLGSLGRTH
ncbi:MAG TPA: radical SAM protein, partial [Acidimicrobiia bacterium]|nr:radical SAM protein [Acidimicrobiia bacterium]